MQIVNHQINIFIKITKIKKFFKAYILSNFDLIKNNFI